MHKFKPGDIVLCNDNELCDYELFRDGIYKVETVICNIFIKVEGINGQLLANRFELVKNATPEPIQLLVPENKSKMVVTKNEQISYFDVDETLVLWKKQKTSLLDIKANYYGESVYLTPHKKHIQFLKSLKSRGGYIVVHSGNGWAWAEEVVKLLKLEEYVDEVKTKPYKIIDDTNPSEWLPPTIYIKE